MLPITCRLTGLTAFLLTVLLIPVNVFCGVSFNHPPLNNSTQSGTRIRQQVAPRIISPAVSRAVPVTSGPKNIFVPTRLTAIGPRIDTTGMTFPSPKHITVASSLSAVGPRVDITGMTFDPPKNISVTVPLSAIGPR